MITKNIIEIVAPSSPVPNGLIEQSITFEKLSPKHIDIVFDWLDKPHVKEFWDTTQAHKDDILNFTNGHKTPSPYANGQYVCWIATAGKPSLCYADDNPRNDAQPHKSRKTG